MRPFINDSESEQARFLEGLGQPVVVEAALPGSDIHTFKEFAFGRELVSAHISRSNPDFHWEHFEGYSTRNVLPHEVTGVHAHSHSVFFGAAT